MSFFCKACARLPVEMINKAVKEAKKKLLSGKVDKSDMKSKAKILKAAIEDLASKTNIDLNLEK
jgi:hypothetical protein